MHNFCTLFDSNYLTRGLAMYDSLKRHCEDFHLYIFAFDKSCLEILRDLNFSRVTVVPQCEFENESLLEVKASRTKGEYCWTCTSHAIRYAIENFHLPEVTYLDADLYFWANPSALLDEFKRADASILITSHRYTPRYDKSETSGIYCVQFVTFKADERGLDALGWWQERCLEWCFARFEDGKFGDQKYLDDWPTRFHGVHVLEHLGGGVAPWNVQQYSLSSQGGKLMVGDTPLVFFHFHDFKQYASGQYDLCLDYNLNQRVIELLYRPYAQALEASEKQVKEYAPEYQPAYTVKKTTYLFRAIIRKIKGTYNVYERL